MGHGGLSVRKEQELRRLVHEMYARRQPFKHAGVELVADLCDPLPIFALPQCADRRLK